MISLFAKVDEELANMVENKIKNLKGKSVHSSTTENKDIKLTT